MTLPSKRLGEDFAFKPAPEVMNVDDPPKSVHENIFDRIKHRTRKSPIPSPKVQKPRVESKQEGSQLNPLAIRNRLKKSSDNPVQKPRPKAGAKKGSKSLP